MAILSDGKRSVRRDRHLPVAELGQPVAFVITPSLAPAMDPIDAQNQQELALRKLCGQLESDILGGGDLRTEQVLERNPGVNEQDAILELIYAEYVARQHVGERPPVDEYLTRFPELRDRLVKLFDVHAAIEPTQAGETTAAGQVRHDTVRWPPGSLEQYEVMEELGRGGMGIVFKARHVGLNRLVAIKRIIGGPDAAAADLHRFRREARAAARLQHPNIVQIHEVGEHDGVPYLALEYAAGGSLSDVVPEEGLAPDRAAQLLLPLVRAMEYAHEKGIVHRDLTPANVLMTEDGVPKITDFGLARAIHDNSCYTQSGAVVGTPNYMAPEQAFGESQSVGPATDVHGLGALLYFALTGQPPFLGVTPLDTMQSVRFDIPVAPSRIRSGIPRDLETVCLKALHKSPAGRYRSAAELAADIVRYERGEPVLARPIGRAARAWRWCGRRPLVAALLALLAITLVSGLVSLTAMWRRAEYHRQLAEERLLDAEENLLVAKSTLSDFTSAVRVDPRLSEPALRPLRQELLRKLVPYYEDLIRRYEGRAALRSEQGDAFLRLAEITAEIGDEQETIELYQSALAAFASASLPERPSYQVEQQTATACKGLANANLRVGAVAAAREFVDRGRATTERLLAEQPGDTDLRKLSAELVTVHAAVCRQESRFDEAIAALTEAEQIRLDLLAAAPDSFEIQSALAGTRFDLAAMLLRNGNYGDAQRRYEELIELDTRLLEQQESSADVRLRLATAQANLGQTFAQRELLDEAERSFLEAVETARPLASQYPTSRRIQEAAANTRLNLALLYTQQGRYAEAEQQLTPAVDALGRLLTRHPRNVRIRFRLASALGQRGDSRALQRKGGAAVTDYKAACEAIERLATELPDAPVYGQALFERHLNSGRLLMKCDQPEEAGRHLELALEMARRRPESEVAARFDIARAMSAAGRWQEQFGQPGRAIEQLTMAISQWKSVPHPAAEEYIADALWRRGLAHRAVGEPRAAVEDFSAVIETRHGTDRLLARSLRAIALAQSGDRAAAEAEIAVMSEIETLRGGVLYNLAAALARTIEFELGQQSTSEAELRTAAAVQRAVVLLQRAAETGFLTASDADAIVADTDFAAVREHPDFREFLQSLDPTATVK